MATRIPIAEEQLCIEALEIKLTDLTNHVQLQKERVSNNFQELHSMLAVREHNLIQELDGVVTEARLEIAEKRKHLQELYTARESVQRDITSNKLREILESNLHALGDKIREELSKEVNVGWVECVWKKEELKECVIDVCKVVILKERPFHSEDYGLKLSPVWSRESPYNNFPFQIAIDDTTHNIFVTDLFGPIQVFDQEGNRLYDITVCQGSIGIALTNDVIYAASGNNLVKVEKSTNECIRIIDLQHRIWDIDIDNNTNIYGCEYSNNSIVVFDNNLSFPKRIELKSSHINFDTRTSSMKIYDNNMFVMFDHNPLFHLQIFSLEGELIRCLIPKSEIGLSYFFTIDKLGNIVVADFGDNEIKIFSTTGELIHTISNDIFPEYKKLCRPTGVFVDRQNRIIVSNRNKNYYLIAF